MLHFFVFHSLDFYVDSKNFLVVIAGSTFQNRIAFSKQPHYNNVQKGLTLLLKPKRDLV